MERAHRTALVCDQNSALGDCKAAMIAGREALALALEASRAAAYRVAMERLIVRVQLTISTL